LELSKGLTLENVISVLGAAHLVGAEHLMSNAIALVANNLPSLIKTPEWKEVVRNDADLLNAIIAYQNI
jgi:hypothetical protein